MSNKVEAGSVGGDDSESSHSSSSNDDIKNNNECESDSDDASEDSSAPFDYDPYDFDEETFDMLKRNDRHADFVELNLLQDEQLTLFQKIDWERDGSSVFANNTRLRRIGINCTSILDDMSERDKRMLARSAKSFFYSLSGNRSIRIIDMHGWMMDVGDTFSLLSPFLENNSKLRSLFISDLALDSGGVHHLVAALSKCSNSLQCIALNRCEGMTADMMEQIIDVVGSQGIQELYLDEYDMNDEVANALGKGLCHNNTLKKLSLDGSELYSYQPRIGSMTAAGMKGFSACLSSPSSSLEDLSLMYNQIGDDGGIALAKGLSHNSTLKRLCLYECDLGIQGGIALAEALEGNTDLEDLDLYAALSSGRREYVLSSEGWAIFFDLLQHCAFHKLNLGGNTIGDDQVAPMVDALDTMNYLNDLDLRYLVMTPPGWVAFFNLMGRPGSVLGRLSHLNINKNGIDDEVSISIANALVNNTSLKTLNWFSISCPVTERGWSAIANTLCNKTSIYTIFDSNHTLEDGPGAMIFPGISPNLFRLNKGTNKAEVARKKIIQYYFLEGKGNNLHEVMRMELEVMPFVIECFGRYDHVVQEITPRNDHIKLVAGLELLYRLTKGMPSLLDSSSKAVGGKRKREA